MNLDSNQIEKAITSKTKAIIPIHMGGQPCEMDRILEIASHYNLAVIEDAAHAFPTRYQGKMVGTIGGHHLLLLLCHQDDHHGRRWDGDDGALGVGGADADDEPPRNQ